MKLIFASVFALILAAAIALAQEPAPGVDSSPPPAPPEAAPPGPGSEPAADLPIPAPYPVARYEAAWSKNPFLRKTVAIVQEKESVLKDWALNGMAEYDGKIRVTMVNKQTGEYKQVTNQDGPDAEFRLIQANFNRVRSDASAEIEKGGEKATIKYDETLTAKPLTINSTQRVGPGTQGQNGANGTPGVPVRPGQQVPTRGNINPPGVGAVVTPPGVAPGAMNGNLQNTPTAPGATPPPSISRRRQLVPVPPPPAPSIPAQQ
jgi:hypothetical protein